MGFFLGLLKPFALKLLAGAALAAAVAAVLLGARQSGRNAERAHQLATTARIIEEQRDAVRHRPDPARPDDILAGL